MIDSDIKSCIDDFSGMTDIFSKRHTSQGQRGYINIGCSKLVSEHIRSLLNIIYHIPIVEIHVTYYNYFVYLIRKARTVLISPDEEMRPNQGAQADFATSLSRYINSSCLYEMRTISTHTYTFLSYQKNIC